MKANKRIRNQRRIRKGLRHVLKTDKVTTYTTAMPTKDQRISLEKKNNWRRELPC